MFIGPHYIIALVYNNLVEKEVVTKGWKERKEKIKSHLKKTEVQLYVMNELLIYGYLRGIHDKNTIVAAEIAIICQLYFRDPAEHNQVIFINDDRILLHSGPKSHQERPERITSMTKALSKSNLLSKCLYVTKVTPCTYNDLITTHDPVYIDKLYQLSAEFDSTDDDDDDNKRFLFAKDFVNVYYNKHSLLSCQVSVGSCITMIKHLLSNYNDDQYGVTLYDHLVIIVMLILLWISVW